MSTYTLEYIGKLLIEEMRLGQERIAQVVSRLPANSEIEIKNIGGMLVAVDQGQLGFITECAHREMASYNRSAFIHDKDGRPVFFAATPRLLEWPESAIIPTLFYAIVCHDIAAGPQYQEAMDRHYDECMSLGMSSVQALAMVTIHGIINSLIKFRRIYQQFDFQSLIQRSFSGEINEIMTYVVFQTFGKRPIADVIEDFVVTETFSTLLAEVNSYE